MELFTVFGISVTLIVLALTQAIKKAFDIPGKFVPLLAVADGILVLFLHTGTLSLELALKGITLGFFAIGLFEQFDRPVSAFLGRVKRG